MRFTRSCWVILLIFFFAPPASARWAKDEESAFAIQYSNSTVNVRQDGSYESLDEFELEVLSEKGRDALKMYSIGYNEGRDSYQILSAQTINGTQVTTVPRSLIEDKSVASAREGFTGSRQVTIAFPNLQVKSRIRLKYKHISKTPPIRGTFHLLSVYGAEAIERRGKIEVYAPVPLYVKKNDPTNALVIEQKNLKGRYYAKIEMVAPVHRVIVEEPRAVIDSSMISSAEISTVSDWATIAKPYAQVIESALTEPLPPDFEKIANEATTLPTHEAKIAHVTAALIKNLNYLGDWRDTSGSFFPRKLKEVAEKKFADCKDYSLATVAILRKLGIPAKLALVKRRNPASSLSSSDFFYLLPSVNHFNHAIVRTELNGAPVWVDPTNPAALLKDVFEDIAGQSALVADANTTSLELIPKNAPDSSRIAVRKYVSFRPAGDIDVMNEIVSGGRASAGIIALNAQVTYAQMERILLQIAGTTLQPDYLRTDPYDLATKVSSDLVFRQTYTSQDERLKSSIGPTFTLNTPHVLDLLFTPFHERVSGVNIGSPGSYRYETTLHHVGLQGKPPESCTINSRWLNASRKLEVRSAGLKAIDEITVLQADVSVIEAMSEPFKALRTKIAECFKSQALILSYRNTVEIPKPEKKPDPAPPSPAPGWKARIKQTVLAWLSETDQTTAQSNVSPAPSPEALSYFPNELLADKESLIQQMEKIQNEMDSDYGPYVRIRFLADEHLLKQPNDPVAYNMLANATLKMGYLRGEEYEPESIRVAKLYSTKALSLGAELPRVLLFRATLHMIEKELDQAEKIASGVLERDPNSFQALGILGELAKKRNTPDKAVGYFHQAISLAPDNREQALFHRLMGDVYRNMGKMELASLSYQKYVDLKAGSPWAHHNYGLFLSSQKKYPEAIQQFETALRLKRFGAALIGLAEAHLMLGWVDLDENSNPTRAIGNFQKAIGYNPDLASAYGGLARAYRILARDDKTYVKLAEDNANKAVQLDPKLASWIAGWGFTNIPTQRTQPGPLVWRLDEPKSGLIRSPANSRSN